MGSEPEFDCYSNAVVYTFAHGVRYNQRNISRVTTSVAIYIVNNNLPGQYQLVFLILSCQYQLLFLILPRQCQLVFFLMK